MHGPTCGHHHHSPATYKRAFAIGVALNLGYVALEAGYGFAVNSLSLLADAGHNLSDVLGLLLAWGAHHLSQWRPTDRRTYGWRSSSILAAVANSCVLLAAVGAIAWEAVRRFSAPEAVPGAVVIWVAGAGVIVNTVTALLFLRGRRHDLNIQGAFLHMAADAGVSLAVLLGGWGILATGFHWIDPLLSLLVAVVILWGTWGLLRESMNLALHAVPRNINPGEIRAFLLRRPGVEAIHDLHIWAMSTTENALTAHLIRPNGDDNDRFLAETSAELLEHFGIHHTTLQIEQELHAELCRQAPEGTL